MDHFLSLKWLLQAFAVVQFPCGFSGGKAEKFSSDINFFYLVFALNLTWKIFYCASLESERYLLISSVFRGILSI